MFIDDLFLVVTSILTKLDSSSQKDLSNVSYSMASNTFNFGLGESKDSYAIISLHKYLSDAAELSKIEHSTITSLKKILTNIDVINNFNIQI